MKMLIFLAIFVIGVANAVEFVPRASALKGNSEIRRAPLPSIASFAPLAKSLRPSSTGIRRAPEVPSSPYRAPYKPRKPVARAPLTPSNPPAFQIPVPQFVPVPIPILTPQEMPTLGTLAPHTFPSLGTLAPHTFPTFTPIPGLPTMPALTMPPSFQRLLGITTTTMKPEKPEKPQQSQDDFEDVEEESSRVRQPTYNKELNSVRSRLSKFVRGEERKTVKADENADWIVPFH